MQKILDWMNDKLVPKMNKITSNVWVQVIRDSMLQLLPFIFIGSIFTVIGIINSVFPGFPIDGNALSGWTFGKISLFVAFLIPFNYCEKMRLRSHRIIAGSVSLILFLIIITPRIEVNEIIGFGDSSLGATGMFCAMVAGVFTSLVVRLFRKFSFFKEDSVIPDFIKEWFDLIVPIFFVVITGWIVVLKLKVDLFGVIEILFKPFSSGMQILGVYICFELARTLFYTMGVSAWVLTGIWTPVTLGAIAKNAELAAAGTATVQNLSMVTAETANAYIMMGGTGATLALSLMLLGAKSRKLKTLGKASIVPSLININEPVMFGCVVWNPILMIPALLNAIALPVSTFIFMKVIPIVPIPVHVFNFWFAPCPVLGYFSSQSIMGVVLVLINLVISGIIYYPFFKVYDNQELQKELEAEG
ncbi:MAG: PTS sugar transporter subunit IIC [Lachnospiraceae bacterium]|nr:PTS sugar transporter subunit IIC [Lachnospiraceae bacterium]